jgi:GNAT superfamily N-acetyltransferase
MAEPTPRYEVCTLEQLREAGVEELLRAHWEEVAHFKDIPLDVDWQTYAEVEARGRLLIIRVTVGAKLVGYAAYFVAFNPKYRTSLQATQDVIFVLPAYRGSRVGYRLVQMGDEHLKRELVQAVYHHTKVKPELDMGPLLARQGYVMVDALWAKRLDRG